MQILYIRWHKYFRKLINGVGEGCPHCRRPYRYTVSGSEYVRRQHRCRRGRSVHEVFDEDDEVADEEEHLEGARIHRGFAMHEMSHALDYGAGDAYYG